MIHHAGKTGKRKKQTRVTKEEKARLPELRGDRDENRAASCWFSHSILSVKQGHLWDCLSSVGQRSWEQGSEEIVWGPSSEID